MDLESVGAFLFCTLIVGVMIAIILGAIKYIKEPTIRDIQEHYILYNGKIYKELDIENVEELLSETN